MTLKQMTMFALAVAKTKNLDSIRMINASSFPHMKEKDQKSLMKELTGQTGHVKL